MAANPCLSSLLHRVLKINEKEFSGTKDQEEKVDAIKINPSAGKGITAIRMSLDGAIRGKNKKAKIKKEGLYFRELLHRLSDTVAFKRQMLGDVVNYLMM